MSRRALIVATGTYADPAILALASPVPDARRLCDLLQRPDVGGYEVTLCLDADSLTARRTVQNFFDDGEYGDLNVMLVSGHGIKDRGGRLHFATVDTELAVLSATSLESRFFIESMDGCAASKQILFIDTCYSGAFAKGMVTTKAAMPSVSRDDFGNDETVGKAIITAATSIQFAGEALINGQTQSVFTRHLIDGIESGEADTLSRGQISLADLFAYVRGKLRLDAPDQTPQPFYYGLDGTTVVALNPRRSRPMEPVFGNGRANQRNTFDLADILDYRVTADVLSLTLEPGARTHIPDIGTFVEDFLERSDATQRYKHTASWIACELLENAFAYSPLVEGALVELKIQTTRDGALISVLQPDDPGFDLESILNDTAKQDSFIQIMARRGLRLHARREQGRLDINMLLPGYLISRATLSASPAAAGGSDPTAYSKESVNDPRCGELQAQSYSAEDKVVAEFSGRVDESTVESFMEYLNEKIVLASKSGSKKVVVDMHQINYMSSRGLRALTLAQREATPLGVEIVLARPNETVREILSISRYDMVFVVTDSI